MNHAPTFVIATLRILPLRSRLVGVFFERKDLRAGDTEVTPSQILADGHNHAPVKSWGNAGQHPEVNGGSVFNAAISAVRLTFSAAVLNRDAEKSGKRCSRSKWRPPRLIS